MEGHSFNSSVYGKKGDQSRFDISYDKIKVRMKHRCLKKESILSLYSDRDDGITTDEFINISEDSLENLFKDGGHFKLDSVSNIGDL